MLAFALVLAACSSTGSTDTTETTAGQTDTTETTAGQTDTTETTAASDGADVPSGTVTFFAYEDAFDENLLGPFEENYPDVNVRIAARGDGAEVIAKLRSGFEADVVNLCVEEPQSLVELGLIQPIDTSRIDTWDEMFESFRTLDGVVVDGETYLVPMVGGTTGILYDEEEVPDGVTSYLQLLTDEALSGRIAIADDALTGIASAALALGYENPLELDEEALQDVKALLIDAKSRIRSFTAGDADTINLFTSGEIVTSTGYPGIATLLQDEGAPVVFTVAEEGQLSWVCGYAISTNAQNLDAAYALINHYAQPEIQRYQAEQFFYMVSNPATLDLIDPAFVELHQLDAPDELQNAIPLRLPENFERWTEIWQEILTG